MNVHESEDLHGVPSSLTNSISTSDLCTMIRCKPRTLQRYARLGMIKPVCRVGRTTMYDYWDGLKLVGMRGKWQKNKTALLDKRQDRAILETIVTE